MKTVILKMDDKIPQLEETREVDQELIAFFKRIDITNAYKDMQHNLGINHLVVGNRSIARFRITDNCNIEQKIKELQDKHSQLLSATKKLMNENVSPFERYVKKLKQTVSEAADEGVRIVIWIEDENFIKRLPDEED